MNPPLTAETLALSNRANVTIERRVASRMRRLSRFTFGELVVETPVKLRAPHSVPEWRKLTDDARLAHLSARVREQVVAEYVAENKAPSPARSKAPAPSAEEAPAPAAPDTPAPAPAPARRLVVPCVAGCGTFHPAASPKPVVVACGSRRESVSRKADRDALSHETTGDAMRALRREAELSLAALGANGKQSKKKPKARRRVACANTRR